MIPAAVGVWKTLLFFPFAVESKKASFLFVVIFLVHESKIGWPMIGLEKKGMTLARDVRSFPSRLSAYPHGSPPSLRFHDSCASLSLTKNNAPVPIYGHERYEKLLLITPTFFVLG